MYCSQGKIAIPAWSFQFSFAAGFTDITRECAPIIPLKYNPLANLWQMLQKIRQYPLITDQYTPVYQPYAISFGDCQILSIHFIQCS
jgi:hypothetical protein